MTPATAGLKLACSHALGSELLALLSRCEPKHIHLRTCKHTRTHTTYGLNPEDLRSDGRLVEDETGFNRPVVPTTSGIA